MLLYYTIFLSLLLSTTSLNLHPKFAVPKKALATSALVASIVGNNLVVPPTQASYIDNMQSFNVAEKVRVGRGGERPLIFNKWGYNSKLTTPTSRGGEGGT